MLRSAAFSLPEAQLANTKLKNASLPVQTRSTLLSFQEIISRKPAPERSAMSKKQLFAVVLALSAIFSAASAGADMPGGTTSTEEQPVSQDNEDPYRRLLERFRAATLSLAEAIAIAERLHPGSRTASVSFEVSAPPGYRVLTVKNNETWENFIDASTGKAAGPETVLSVGELDDEDRNNLIGLRSVKQELSDAVRVAEKAGSGKALHGGLIQQDGRLNFDCDHERRQLEGGHARAAESTSPRIRSVSTQSAVVHELSATDWRAARPPTGSRRDGDGLTPAIKTERTGTKRDHLQKTAGDRDVLQEMNHLVLVGHIVVEQHSSRQREDCQCRGRDAGLKTKQQSKPAAQLDDNCDGVSDWSKRRAGGLDESYRVGRRSDLRQTGHNEDERDQQPAEGRKVRRR
jgi:hypothetical protein